MQLSENAIRILESRYLLKDPSGRVIEQPTDLFRRVALHISQAEIAYGNESKRRQWEHAFYTLMSSLKFLPNSPTLMNAGTSAGQLSACFVLPVNDSIEGIFRTLKNAAIIHQGGGGTGFNFSPLRPIGDFISSGAGNASGPLSFMNVFDAATENIKQGGKRRGANMGVLNCDHPDIEEFITVKSTTNTLRNFNISVGIYDAFMEAVIKNKTWKLLHPVSRKCVKKIKASYLWNLILQNAWRSGDPGLIFLDTINYYNPTPGLGNIDCTNPCGEVPLMPYEACNLGSIDVSKFSQRNTHKINWAELENAVITAIRFLDNVIDMNNYLLPEIKTMVTGNRKIGLGIMGWADLLIELEIPYESARAVALAGQVMKFISSKSLQASQHLARERGVFRNWNHSIYAPGKPLRNATRTSIAPTGTISLIAGASSSVEPLFALAISRKNVLGNQQITEINKPFLTYLEKKNLFSDAVLQHVKEHGTIASYDLPEKTKKLFKTALEIKPAWHLKHQVAFQQYTDNAVSKTINLPFETPYPEIGKIYLEAWKKKLKGITVFRQASKAEQVLYPGLDAEAMSCEVCRN